MLVYFRHLYKNRLTIKLRGSLIEGEPWRTSVRLKQKVCQGIPLEVWHDVVSTSDTVGSTDNGDNLGGGEADRSKALEDGGDAVSWLRNEVGGRSRLGLRTAHQERNAGSTRALDQTHCSSELNAESRRCERRTTNWQLSNSQISGRHGVSVFE